jgi:hypothetical protein
MLSSFINIVGNAFVVTVKGDKLHPYGIFAMIFLSK